MQAAEHNPQTVVHSKAKAMGHLEHLTASAGCSLERTMQATCKEEASIFFKHTGASHKPALEHPSRPTEISPAGEEGDLSRPIACVYCRRNKN